MLHEYIRVFSKDGSLIDRSIVNQEQEVATTYALDTSKYIYVGSYYPFNNLHFYVSTVNAVSANLVIEYWDGKEWIQAVDILDSTAQAGATMARSGVVQWTPRKRNSWQYVTDTSENSAPTELQSLFVYDCYWLRISASAAVSFGLKEISYAFTTTDQINDLDIEISGFYESFEAGKTDWIREILTASRLVLSDLKRSGLVANQGEILRFDDVSLMTDYKTLDLIYMNLGDSYIEKRKEIISLYDKAMSSKRFTFDTDSDGMVDRQEISNTIKVMQR